MAGAGMGGGVETGAAGVAATGIGDEGAAGAGVAADAGLTPFPTGMGFPHFGHFTSVGILAGMALIFSFAMQFPHSMGINSIPFSFIQIVHCPTSRR